MKLVDIFVRLVLGCLLPHPEKIAMVNVNRQAIATKRRVLLFIVVYS